MEKISNQRRDFIKKAVVSAVGLSIGGIASGLDAKSYSRIMGANNRTHELDVARWAFV